MADASIFDGEVESLFTTQGKSLTWACLEQPIANNRDLPNRLGKEGPKEPREPLSHLSHSSSTSKSQPATRQQRFLALMGAHALGLVLFLNTSQGKSEDTSIAVPHNSAS